MLHDNEESHVSTPCAASPLPVDAPRVGGPRKVMVLRRRAPDDMGKGLNDEPAAAAAAAADTNSHNAQQRPLDVDGGVWGSAALLPEPLRLVEGVGALGRPRRIALTRSNKATSATMVTAAPPTDCGQNSSSSGNDDGDDAVSTFAGALRRVDPSGVWWNDDIVASLPTATLSSSPSDGTSSADGSYFVLATLHDAPGVRTARAAVVAWHARMASWRKQNAPHHTVDAGLFRDSVSVQRLVEFDLHCTAEVSPVFQLSPTALTLLRAVDVAWASDDAEPFRYPIDTHANPTYGKQIKEPLCLVDLYDEIRSGAITDPATLLSRFDVIQKNCVRFNGESNSLTSRCRAIYALARREARGTGIVTRLDGSPMPMPLVRELLTKMFLLTGSSFPPQFDARPLPPRGGSARDGGGADVGSKVQPHRTRGALGSPRNPVVVVDNDEDDRAPLKNKGKKKGKQSISTAPAEGQLAGPSQTMLVTDVDEDDEKQHWAQCDVCDAWHEVAEDVSHLPAWTCSLIGAQCVKGQPVVVVEDEEEVVPARGVKAAQQRKPKPKPTIKESAAKRKKRPRSDPSKKSKEEPRGRATARSKSGKKRGPSSTPSSSGASSSSSSGSSSSPTLSEASDATDESDASNHKLHKLYKKIAGKHVPTTTRVASQGPSHAAPLRHSKTAVRPAAPVVPPALAGEVVKLCADATTLPHSQLKDDVLANRYAQICRLEERVRGLLRKP